MARTSAPVSTPIADRLALSDEERAALLVEIQSAARQGGETPRQPTPRERLIAELIRDRDHLEGCPIVEQGANPAGLVEAYEQKTPAPPAALQSLGVRPGDVVVVVRCMRCSGVHHYASPAPVGTREGDGLHVQALLEQRLTPSAAVALDGSL